MQRVYEPGALGAASSRHARASTKVGGALDGPFDSGIGGPGGWLLLFEPELHLGADVLVPDMAGTPILRSLVRDDILRDLTYTGRIFSAEEAMSYGLATRICSDPRAVALDVAPNTANYHVKQLFARLDAHDRAEAVARIVPNH